MQVNLNTNINQSRPNFKALKGIDFGPARNYPVVQQELLKTFDNIHIKKLFEKYDGKIKFFVKEQFAYRDNYEHWREILSAKLELDADMQKVKDLQDTYIKKAAKENIDMPNEKIYDFTIEVGLPAKSQSSLPPMRLDPENALKILAREFINSLNSLPEYNFINIEKIYSHKMNENLADKEYVFKNRLQSLINERSKKNETNKAEDFVINKLKELLG